jgi:hypothetical protein
VTLPRRLWRSLSFRLLAIFVSLAFLFVWGSFVALRWVYNSDNIRGLISGHLSLHVHYVREDIGSPPSIENALAITEAVPVDIRITGPGVDWASDPEFPAPSSCAASSSRTGGTTISSRCARATTTSSWSRRGSPTGARDRR